MNLNELLAALEASPPAVAIAESGSLFPWIESIHVLALTLVVGSIAIVDLRLLGVLAHHRSISRLAREVLPITWTAFVGAVVTGLLLFASAAVTYAQNPAFLLKLVLLGVAGLNVAVFHVVTFKGVAGWDEALRTPAAARAAGALSLALWIAVVAAGRWIGFVTVDGP